MPWPDQASSVGRNAWPRHAAIKPALPPRTPHSLGKFSQLKIAVDMKLLIALAVLVAGASAAVDVPFDVNPFLSDMMTDVQKMEEADCGCKYGCKPTIVRYPYEQKNKSSVIQPVTGARANVALIVYWGTCSIAHKGYTWYIDWGDGQSSRGYYDDLLQVQSLHQYDSCGYYRICARYCSTYRNTAGETSTRGNCDYYSRVIDVTFDPGH